MKGFRYYGTGGQRIKRRMGHSALRVRDGKIEGFDPNPEREPGNYVAEVRRGRAWLIVCAALFIAVLLASTCSRAEQSGTAGAQACLSLNVYHEGNKKDGVFTEPLIGLFAIGLTTLERTKGDHTKVCDVVRHYKQFSWTLDPPPVETNRAWRDAQDIAYFLLNPKFTEGSTHFWAFYSKPYWRNDMDFTGQWGNHMFGKERRKSK